MTKRNIAVALALLSTIMSTQVFAQSEPAAYAAQHPDRDVLNEGALTPAARAAAGLENPTDVYGVVDNRNPVSARGTRERVRRRR